MKPHKTSRLCAPEALTRLSISAKLTGYFSSGTSPPWMSQTGFSSFCATSRVRMIGVEEGDVFVDRLGNDVEMQPLGGARLLEHEERQAFGRAIGQPFLDGDAVAL